MTVVLSKPHTSTVAAPGLRACVEQSAETRVWQT